MQSHKLSKVCGRIIVITTLKVRTIIFIQVNLAHSVQIKNDLFSKPHSLL